MATVLEAPSPTLQAFPGQEMPSFASGTSQTQVLEVNPGKGQEKIPLTPKGLKQRVVHFINHRFGPDHLFGSVMTGFYLYRWGKNALSAFPEPEGKDKRSITDILSPTEIRGAVDSAVQKGVSPEKKDKVHIASKATFLGGSYLAFLTNVYMFFSSRGGTPPEGKNLAEKTLNAFKSFNNSALFVNCVLMGSAILSLSTSKLIGATKNFMKLQEAAKAKNLTGTEAKLNTLDKRATSMQLASGIFYLIAVPITYISMFNIGDKEKKEKAEAKEPANTQAEENAAPEVKPFSAFKESEVQVLSVQNLKKSMEPYSPRNIVGALSYAFKNDKAGLVARFSMIAAEFLQMGEGLSRGMERKKVLIESGVSPDKASKEVRSSVDLAKSGLLGAVFTFGHMLYGYGRMLAESRQQAVNGQEMVR